MNLVTGSVKNTFTGIFANHFDTFSANTTITIFKEPIKEVIYTNNDNVYAGYGTNQLTESYNYIPVSGIFPAIEVVSKMENDLFSTQTKIRNPEKETLVKVKPDAKEYMDNGRTDKIVLNGKTYNDISLERVQNFFGLKYYYYNLKRTD